MFSIVSANMNTTLGIHGYDNAESNMHPYFIARGPLIKKNHVIAPFDTVDLYSLFAHILNISAPPNNGSLANVVDMLVVMPSHLTATPSVFFMVVSFDGFRYNYFNKGVTPTMDSLKQEGSRAEYMHNVFPTKTFPNHHSIATGLYPESHGVLGNSVYDPVKKRVLGYSADLYKNSEVTPIWTLNQNARDGRHSGVMMWPGGEFEYKQTLPTFRQPFDLNTAWEIRVDTVIGWILHRSTPANLVMLYFEEPDRRAHAFGPESPVVITHIEKLDNITRYLRQKLSANNLLGKVNVVQLSDHGMDSVTFPRIINLTDFVDKTFGSDTGDGILASKAVSLVRTLVCRNSASSLRLRLSSGCICGIVGKMCHYQSLQNPYREDENVRVELWNELNEVLNACEPGQRIILFGNMNGWVGTQEENSERVIGRYGDDRVNENGKENTVYQTLKTSSKNRHYKIYRKAELPERWHYKNNLRTPPLLAVADEGYGFHDMYAAEQYFAREWHITMSPKMVFGLHGYDNSEPNMRPFFLSWGPCIKKNYVVSPFNTIDLYSLFSKILELTPPKTNGTGIYVEAILKTKT
uniref:Uncharacterized protein n=1 Tax=Timema shepardi TaxID=629360 RepID=A0A7R9AZ78_TIMSH|nr:unnamed protein product [Timema shepardi]